MEKELFEIDWQKEKSVNFFFVIFFFSVNRAILRQNEIENHLPQNNNNYNNF